MRFATFKYVLASLLLAVVFISPANSQHYGYTTAVSIDQDVAGNFNGGKETGWAHAGLINLCFTMNTGELGMWNNGTFRVHLQNTYGQQPSENLVGDLQVFNNIESQPHTYLFQLWYKHKMNDLTVIVGKHDLNAVFFVSERAGLYINSSFGIMPLASLNVPVSIFPNTTLGLVGIYEGKEGMAFRAGVYNGRPGEITRSNFGTDLNLEKGNGLFYVGEIHLEDLFPQAAGTYKLGAFHHSGQVKPMYGTSSAGNGDSGVYFIADQNLLSDMDNSEPGMGALLQLGYAPGRSNLNDFYLAGGLNYTGLFSNNRPGRLGLAVARASFNRALPTIGSGIYEDCETVVELTYRYRLPGNLVIQPDLQYIIHPGMKNTLDNAFTGLFRVSWRY